MGGSVAVSQKESGAFSAFFRETGGSLKSVFVNRNLRRMQLAFAGSLIGNWAFTTAVSVWAYGEGGAKAVGIYYCVRLAIMASSTRLVTALATK